MRMVAFTLLALLIAEALNHHLKMLRGLSVVRDTLRIAEVTATMAESNRCAIWVKLNTPREDPAALPVARPPRPGAKRSRRSAKKPRIEG
jgi:hypothetical protein